MKKKLVAILLVMTSIATLLSGCGGYDEISRLNSISSLGSESNASDNYKLSYTDKQQMIYAQVSDRTLLDLSTLDACSDNEVQQVVNYMNSVDDQLVGTVPSSSGVIDSCFTDYLLAEFEKTPYYWQRNKMIIRGIDAESRSIVVDVSYKTIDYKKNVIGNSRIVKGEPNYDKLVQTRYLRYLNILNMKLDDPYNPRLKNLQEKFKKVYGSPSAIYKEQSNLSLSDYLYETGNQKTYKGAINTNEEQTGGTMTVRFVLVPKYVLGINLGMDCKHMYITDYQVSKDYTEGLEIFNREGYATVTDRVYELIYSYFKCIDESDFDGLYKLTTDFGTLDKYYQDLFDTTYRKHNNFSISLFDIRGTHITCGITISSKIRAAGSNMTMPIYTDRYYVEIELVGDTLKIDNMTLLSRKLEGEPAIKTDDADTSGFSASIDLDNDDKIAIEKLICNFSLLQMKGDTSSEDFEDTVDLSISTSELSSLKEDMTAVTGKNKVVWLQNYQQGTSNYASVKCRELYQSKDNSIVEANVVYDFILKGGRWIIFRYDILSTVKLDTTNLQTTGSLCLVSDKKVEAYTSQLKSTVSSDEESVSDISITYNYDAYKPVKRSGSKEQGLVALEGKKVTKAVWNEMNDYYDIGCTYDEYLSNMELVSKAFSTIGVETSYYDQLKKEDLELVAYLYNINKGKYTPKQKAQKMSEMQSIATLIIGELEEYSSQVTSEEYQKAIDTMQEKYNVVLSDKLE